MFNIKYNRREMKLKVRGEKYDVYGQVYILPTIKVTHDKNLYGYYTIDLVWGKWGLSLTFE